VAAQVIAVAVATAGVVSAVIGVLGYRLQARQASRQARDASRQVREAAIGRAQTVYLSGMNLLASGRPQERLVGMIELRTLVVDPTAGEYAQLAQQALDHLLPLLDSLPPALDGLDPPGTH